MTGIDLIAAERERQVSQEGYSAEHDQNHDDGSLAQAAACYCVGSHVVWWPWKDGYKPRDRISNLAKAGALIAAEIDRLNSLKG